LRTGLPKIRKEKTEADQSVTGKVAHGKYLLLSGPLVMGVNC
jgi:hypothetical protein